MKGKSGTHRQLKDTFLRSVFNKNNGGIREIWDSGYPGFGVRISGTGKIRFQTIYWLDDGVDENGKGKRRKVRQSLGAYPATSLADARKEYLQVRRDLENGDDPKQQREIKRHKRQREHGETFGKVVDAFVEQHVRKNRTAGEQERLLRHHAVPKWDQIPITEISVADVSDLLDEVAEKSGIYTANRVLAIVRKLFNWSVTKGKLAVPPIVKGMARSGEEIRKHTLTLEEFRAVWTAAESLGYPFGHFTRMLILTGQRLSEVAGMRWSQIELEKRLWKMVARDTKSNREHVVPLTNSMIEILQTAPRHERCDYIFTTTFRGPIRPGGKLKDDLQELTKTDGWRFHDIRRTVATMLANEGTNQLLIGRILNHADQTTTGGVYNQYQYLREKFDALSEIDKIIRGEKEPREENLVKLGDARASGENALADIA